MISDLESDSTLRRVVIGALRLPAQCAVWKPGLLALSGRPTDTNHARIQPPLIAGDHEIVAYQRSRLEMVAVVTARAGAHVVDWRPLGFEMQSHLVIAPADIEKPVDFPGRAHPDGVDARSWVHIAALLDGRPYVWIEDPAGVPAIRTHVGLDAAGSTAAILVEMRH